MAHLQRPGWYSTTSSGRDLYSSPSFSTLGNAAIPNGEIDLRSELDELFYGFNGGVRHGHLVLLRRMRRTASGKHMPCTCLDSFTREPDLDCSYCLGEGYLFDEEWHWTYSMFSGTETNLTARYKSSPPGNVKVDYRIFFMRYDVNVKYGDKIVEVKLDANGEIAIPYVRESIYKPQTIDKLRSDNSRIEYLAIYCKEDNAIRPENANE